MKLDATEAFLYLMTDQVGYMYLSRINVSDGTESWTSELFAIEREGSYHYESGSLYLRADMEVQRFSLQDVIVSNFYKGAYSGSGNMMLVRVMVDTVTGSINN
jgi:hypothetical protein